MTETLVLVANAKDATITTFLMDAASLTPLATNPLPGPCGTFVVDEARGLLYAGCKGDPALLVTYRLDRTGGVLTELHRTAVPDALTYVDLAHDGTVLLGASYGGGAGYTWVVRDGVPGGVVSRIEYPNLHCSVATRDGCAYLVSLGADLVAQFDVSDAGVLTPLDAPTVALPGGSGPRHLVFDADQTTGYLVTEFSGEVHRLVRGASGELERREAVSIVDPTAGLARSRLGADPVTERLIWGADVHVTPDTLLASERTASTLAVVPLGEGGVLTGAVSFHATEAQPRGFTTTPDAPPRVLAVGERSTMLALSALREGRLEPLDRVATGRGANWVRVVAR